MYSLTAVVPGRVSAIARELRPRLTAFETIRDQHTILIKRLGDKQTFTRAQKRLRSVLAGTAPIDVTVTGIDYFADPPRGTAPVVYLSLESPDLDALHHRLVEAFGAVHTLEGPEYTMHITLARGGDPATAQRLTDRSIDPVSWTISELQLWDADQKRPVSTIGLPVQGRGGVPS